MRRIDEAPGHPEIVRITAPNPGPMTLEGTNTYVVGRDPAWVIDPGPADAGHVEVVRGVAEERGGIGGVVLTHSHSDHTAGVELLGADVLVGSVSEGDEGSPPPPAAALSAGANPEAVLPSTSTAGAGQDSLRAVGPFEVVPTPGHAVDHVCFSFIDVVFCGDLILGFGSSIVPSRAMGGSLSDYMRSLVRLEALEPSLLCPGHGPWIADPAAKISEYRAHRMEREDKLVAALEAGVRDRDGLLDAAWGDVPAPMRPAAAIAMQAHLEKLEDEGGLPPGFAPGDAA